MAEMYYTQAGHYKNVDVYDKFDYIDYDYSIKTLTPVWTTSGMLIPITHVDKPAYMRIPREECIKMINDLLDMDMLCKAMGLTIKKD